MTSKKLKLIAISSQNYYNLKKLGCAGDSFNDVLTTILQKKKLLQPSQVGRQELDVTNGMNQLAKEEHNHG